jgi:hypothetical protein
MYVNLSYGFILKLMLKYYSFSFFVHLKGEAFCIYCIYIYSTSTAEIFLALSGKKSLKIQKG